ncbi:MAG: 50S ribosomal protein L6 [Deltaproteobacteria bacterium]|nr:50S ribosomal protein L6 [Deltaproteobacteria bacterium]
MSRIGKLPIDLPGAASAQLGEGTITVQGPKGKMEFALDQRASVRIDGKQIIVERPSDSRTSRAVHGMVRSLIANAVHGVTEGFVRKLEINGVGYRAEAKGRELHLALGYSHPVVYPLPEGVSAQTPAPTQIVLEGIDKQAVGMAAAQVRALRPPEPYKGKGIKYAEEHIRRKVGKTGA